MRRPLALSFGVLLVLVIAVGCAATGSDSEVHGPIFSFDASATDEAAAGGDSAPASPDAPSASEAAAPDGAAPVDAPSPDDVSALDAPGDVSAFDASDAATFFDASEASTSDASDASTLDASDACAGFDAATNPFVAVSAVAGTTTIADHGTVAANQAVGINAWTTPAGVMQIVNVAYTTDGFATPAQLVPLTLAAVDAGAGQEEWSGLIPGQTAGTAVTWYVVGYDACSSAAQYYSNLGNNYHYTAQ